MFGNMYGCVRSSSPPESGLNAFVLVAVAVGDVRPLGDDEPTHRTDGGFL